MTFAQNNFVSLDPVAFSKSLSKDPNAVLLDVRTDAEYNNNSHLKNSISADIQSDKFKQVISSIDKSKTIYVYCAVGGRSAVAATKLKGEGFTKVYNLQGGLNAWKDMSLPVE